MGDIFRGVLPFVFGVLAVLGLLAAFPGLALWLPGRMGWRRLVCDSLLIEPQSNPKLGLPL